MTERPPLRDKDWRKLSARISPDIEAGFDIAGISHLLSTQAAPDAVVAEELPGAQGPAQPAAAAHERSPRARSPRPGCWEAPPSTHRTGCCTRSIATRRRSSRRRGTSRSMSVLGPRASESRLLSRVARPCRPSCHQGRRQHALRVHPAYLEWWLCRDVLNSSRSTVPVGL